MEKRFQLLIPWEMVRTGFRQLQVLEETGSTPRAGAIVSFVGGTHGTPAIYGHVAFVEKVYDDGSFLVSETNYGGNPNYTFRKISQADSAISFAYTMK